MMPCTQPIKQGVRALQLAIAVATPAAAEIRPTDHARLDAVTARLDPVAARYCIDRPAPCQGVPVIRDSEFYSAVAQGEPGAVRPVINTALIRRSNDDALAFVVAHEMAHVILNHQRPSRSNEEAADLLGARITCEAGFDIRGLKPVLWRFWFAWLTSLPVSPAFYPSPSARWRAVRTECDNTRAGELP